MTYGLGSALILIALIFAAVPMGEAFAAMVKDREEEYD